ncbi:MAG TPA: cupin domain-containing protein [Rudaea sp.]|jgi:50S ribosomal protein L16 3-hydroxylase|nr:cupin domain-containing protein [Rudaea sp.]
MTAPSIEVRARRNQFLGMSPAQFLRGYWQKKPLLIRGAFAAKNDWIAPNDLAGLACEELALSRIVKHDAKRDCWTVRNGPFTEKDFAKLPKKDWTLLVQDVDKWDTDVAPILDAFSFIPSWRIDDVMVSYAEDRGGVGAHVDHYDVFLIQGIGRRRWRIDADKKNGHEFRDDAELKLLRKFTPTHEWILEPGDALYLPPGIAHEGTATGECMTFSVGMRAPSNAELMLDFSEFLAETLGDDLRYADPDLTSVNDPNEITDHALKRLRASLPRFADVDKSTLATWFGKFITRYRAAHDAAPSPKQITKAQLARILPTHDIVRNPWSRMAWTRDGRNALLFIAGESYSCPQNVAELVSGSRDIDGIKLLKHHKALGLFTDLINRGHWLLRRSK